MDTNQMDTAALIVAAMIAAERSKKWTADKAGIALSTFDRKLRRGGDFTISEVARVAKVLQVRPSSLLPEEFAEHAVADAA